jgi:VWFA-related protein
VRPQVGVLITAVLAGAAIVRAQQPTQPVFRSGVDVVTVDVSVVDKDGHPIKGLRPENFTVTLNGKPRPVRALDYVEAGAPGAPASPRAPEPAGSSSPARTGRVIVILFDDLSYKPGPGRGLVESALRLLPTFAADDLVGVTTTSGLGPTVNPTRDHATVEAALRDKRLVGRYDDSAAPFFIGMDEALEIERGVPADTLEQVVTRECSIVFPSPGQPPRPEREFCPHLVEAAARRLAQTTVTRTEMQLAAYESLISALKPAPAPRVIVALTNGMATSAARGELQQQLEPVSRAASDAGVQFYALTETAEGADGGDLTVERAQARRVEGRFLSDGIQTVASAAGGQTFLVTGTADRFFRRIYDETAGFYRLAIDAPNPRAPARYLKAKVTVNAAGATVRAHADAVARAVAETADAPLAGSSIEDRLQATLEQGGAVFGVPISLTTALRHDPDPAGQLQLAVGVEVPGTVPAPLTAMFALVDETGRILKEAHARVPRPSPGADYFLAFPIPLEPGGYRLRFAVGDAGGNVGAVEHQIAGRLMKTGAYSASELLMSWTDASGAARLLALDTLPDDAVACIVALELYPDDPSASSADVTVQLALFPIGEQTPIIVRTLKPTRNGSTLSVAAEIPARGLGAGTYLVRAAVIQGGEVKGGVTTSIRKAAIVAK